MSFSRSQRGANQASATNGPESESERLYEAEPATSSPDATPVVEPDEVAVLRIEIAKLQWLRQHLQKDVVVKDAYLAVLRTDLEAREAEIVQLRTAMVQLHADIARTLEQPRYRAADAVNRVLRRARGLHAFLKRWLIRRQRASSTSGSSPTPSA